MIRLHNIVGNTPIPVKSLNFIVEPLFIAFELFLISGLHF